MVVVDTSALLDRLTARPSNVALRNRLDTEVELHAPHLIDVEFVHALRRLVRVGDVGITRAEQAMADLENVAIQRYPHVWMRTRIWQLRESLSAYDACFVALAEMLDATLITTDSRLSRSSGHTARVELF